MGEIPGHAMILFMYYLLNYANIPVSVTQSPDSLGQGLNICSTCFGLLFPVINV